MHHDTPRPAEANTWCLLSRTDGASLSETRLTLHHTTQLLASFGQALVEPRTDDSHRSMTWDAGTDSFSSETTADRLQASLSVPDFTLALGRDGSRLASLKLAGRTLSEAKGWLEERAREAGAPATELAWPEYDLPEHTAGRDNALEPNPEVLAALAAWYANAATHLEAIARTVPEASEVRCWPHHFDLATLFTFPGTGAHDDARYVGLGFSPGDASRDLPYYYVNGWPAPAPADLRALAGPGAWNTEGWVGAVLTADDIVAITDHDAQRAMVDGFLDDAISAMRAALLA